MPSPQYKNKVLFVMAVETAHVREIDTETGMPASEPSATLAKTLMETFFLRVI